MVKTIELYTVTQEINEILSLIELKISDGLIADFIEDKDNYLHKIESSLVSIESKLKNSNKIYELYFRYYLFLLYINYCSF